MYDTIKYNIKIINTSQGYIYKYEDLKWKICNCNANTYFNQKYLRKNIIPNFAKINISNISPASQYTRPKVSTISVKEEMKYLYIKNWGLCALPVHYNWGPHTVQKTSWITLPGPQKQPIMESKPLHLRHQSCSGLHFHINAELSVVVQSLGHLLCTSRSWVRS